MNLAFVVGQNAVAVIDTGYTKTMASLMNFEELAGRNASWTYLERESASFK